MTAIHALVLLLLIVFLWQRHRLHEAQRTIKYQRTWITALERMVRKNRRERDHAVKGMIAFFPAPADNPEGWDA